MIELSTEGSEGFPVNAPRVRASDPQRRVRKPPRMIGDCPARTLAANPQTLRTLRKPGQDSGVTW